MKLILVSGDLAYSGKKSEFQPDCMASSMAFLPVSTVMNPESFESTSLA